MNARTVRRAKRYVAGALALALPSVGCGGSVDGEPEPRACAYTHDLVDGRCRLRTLAFPGGTVEVGTQPGHCSPPCEPHTVTVAPFRVAVSVLYACDLTQEGCRFGVKQGIPLDVAGYLSAALCESFGLRRLTEFEMDYLTQFGRGSVFERGNGCAPKGLLETKPGPSWTAVFGPDECPPFETPSGGLYSIWGTLARHPSGYTPGYPDIPEVMLSPHPYVCTENCDSCTSFTPAEALGKPPGTGPWCYNGIVRHHAYARAPAPVAPVICAADP